MERLPNPFGASEEQNSHVYQSHSKNSDPGFLLMTRPPYKSGYGSPNRGFRSFNRSPHFPQCSTPRYSNSNISSSGSPSDNSFISFNQNDQKRQANQNVRYFDNSQSNDSYHNNSRGSSPSHNSTRGSSSFHNNSTGSSPFHGLRGSPYEGNKRFRGNGSRGYQHFNNRGGRGNFSPQSPNFRGGGGRGKGPLKDIPIEKFITRNMVSDPWSLFECDSDKNNLTNSSSSLDIKAPEEDKISMVDSESKNVSNSHNDSLLISECTDVSTLDCSLLSSDSPVDVSDSNGDKDSDI